MRDLFREDSDRFQRFSVTFEDLLLDYSKNRITPDTMQFLAALATEAKLERAIEEMFSGAKINITEQRPALHTALRNRVCAQGVCSRNPLERELLRPMGR